MVQLTITRKQRIKMFVYEYYLGVSKWLGLVRFIGGPVYFVIGLKIYDFATDRLEIAFGGFLVVLSVYYFFKPVWWVVVFWKNFKTIDFQLELGENQLMIEEDGAFTKIDYGKFDKICRRPEYFVLSLGKRSKVYLPVKSLSDQAIETLQAKCV
ncbi:MAG: hypothetical protein K9J17_00595 [Flavobacteriales bacterium]|nr:hypothetical protein [Flavobacteriales bacterium]